jgi:hypothetical protein
MSTLNMSSNEIESLEKQLSETRALLTNTVDTLEAERRLAAATKNKVSGGYYMMSRAAEKNLRILQNASPSGALVFSVIRENMQMGTNAVTISNGVLAKLLGKSRATVTRAISYLSSNNYVQIIKVGNVNTYVVNEQIAFSGRSGQRTAVYSATMVAHESEQEEGWDNIKKLKSVPLIFENERAILGSEDLPPPDQKDIDLN